MSLHVYQMYQEYKHMVGNSQKRIVVPLLEQSADEHRKKITLQVVLQYLNEYQKIEEQTSKDLADLKLLSFMRRVQDGLGKKQGVPRQMNEV